MIQGLSRTVNWLYGKHKISILPGPTKNQVVELKRCGFLGKSAGIPIRARLVDQQKIDEWCTSNLKGKKSMDFKIHERSEFGEQLV